MAIQGIDAATDPTKKLDITLNNKPANYQLLQQDKLFYMKIGLTKIHRILEFVQSKWLKTYKEFNTKKCQAATSTFEKDLFKLMKYSAYRKVLQKNHRHLDIRIVTDARRVKKYIESCVSSSYQADQGPMVPLRYHASACPYASLSPLLACLHDLQ